MHIAPISGQDELRGAGFIWMDAQGIIRGPDRAPISGVGAQFGFIDLMRYSPTPGSDMTAQILEACEEARELNYVLKMPPFRVMLSQTAIVRGMVGYLGLSELELSPDFTLTGYGNQFCILNPNFATGFNEATADAPYFKRLKIITSPNASRSVLGLANTQGGLIEDLEVVANRVMVGGKPVAVGALIDVYACVKNLDINRPVHKQLTGGYGLSKISEDGGGCLWVRNFLAGFDPANATENVRVRNGRFVHTTSDECIAIFGSGGLVRNCEVFDCEIAGLDSIDGVYQPALMSIFPLGGSAVGNAFRRNKISAKAWMYNVIRIGNAGGSDPAHVCTNNTSEANEVYAYRDSGSHAAWVAAGSPVGLDPDIASQAIACQEGTQGVAYPADTSGNISRGDLVYSNGPSTVNAAFSGWQALQLPTCYGNVYTGASFCRNVQGGKIEVFARPFYNSFATGTEYRVNGADAAYVVCEVDYNGGGIFGMSGCNGFSAGGFARIDSIAANCTVILSDNKGPVALGVGVNNGSASCTVSAHLNVLPGGITAPSSGTGITSSLNLWGTTPD